LTRIDLQSLGDCIILIEQKRNERNDEEESRARPRARRLEGRDSIRDHHSWNDDHTVHSLTGE